MAVLVEGYSVIVRMAAIEARLRGGWEAFQQWAPARTLCTDGEIVRVGFETAAEASAFVEALERGGLEFLREGKAVDIAEFRQVVDGDRLRTEMTPCDWTRYSYLVWTESGWRIALCGLEDSQLAEPQLVLPAEWDYETSPSRYLQVPVD